MTTMTRTGTLIGAAVSLHGDSRTYGRGPAAVRAVDDVTLDFLRGGWTAVMGPSGSGRSTLLYSAAGLERVDVGRVFVGDTDITKAGNAELTALRRPWSVPIAGPVPSRAARGPEE
jgi:putative ABC transport system ATP-binding protein